MKKLKGILAVAILAPIVLGGFVLAAFGGDIFKRCMKHGPT